MTYQEAAQAALDCQDACNSSGILMTFTDAMLAICEEAHRRGEGTRWKNTHPVAILFLLKLSELAGCGTTLDPSYGPAEAQCKLISGSKDGGGIVSEGEAEEQERQSWETPTQTKARTGV